GSCERSPRQTFRAQLEHQLRSDFPYHSRLLLPPRALYTRRKERKQGGPQRHHCWSPTPPSLRRRTGPRTLDQWTPAKRIFNSEPVHLAVLGDAEVDGCLARCRGALVHVLRICADLSDVQNCNHCPHPSARLVDSIYDAHSTHAAPYCAVLAPTDLRAI